MVGAARSRWLKEIPILKLIGRKAERGDFLIQWDAGHEGIYPVVRGRPLFLRFHERLLLWVLRLSYPPV